MSTQEIEIYIGGRAYKLNLQASEISRVREMAMHFDKMFSQIRQSTDGNFDRDRMMVLAALMLLDEHFNLKEKHEQAATDIDQFHANLADKLESLAEKVAQ